MPPIRRQPRSRARRILDFLIFVVLVAIGGTGLVPLYQWLHRPLHTHTSAGGVSPQSSPSPGSDGTPPQQNMVLFDDFHYSGRDDPALAAHGWAIRTKGGGPGIANTWTSAGVSFPSVSSAQGGRALQLQVRSDGTTAGTQQSELVSTNPSFYEGTYAARVYFTDGPATGTNGDHINEAFYAISPSTDTERYSELDYEYMPNGGWGSPLPELDTTSWRTSKQKDRVYRPQYQRLHGWHTVMVTVLDGKVAYYLDNTKLFTSASPYALHGPVDVAFSTWLIDLPFTGQRVWNMQINWFYYRADKVLTPTDVNKAVSGYYASETHFVDTMK